MPVIKKIISSVTLETLEKSLKASPSLGSLVGPFSYSPESSELRISFSRSLTGSEDSDLETILANHIAVVSIKFDESKFLDEMSFNSKNLITSSTTWSDDSKTNKVEESSFTYNGRKLVSVITNYYDRFGQVDKTVTKTITYTGNNINSISREGS